MKLIQVFCEFTLFNKIIYSLSFFNVSNYRYVYSSDPKQCHADITSKHFNSIANGHKRAFMKAIVSKWQPMNQEILTNPDYIDIHVLLLFLCSLKQVTTHFISYTFVVHRQG